MAFGWVIVVDFDFFLGSKPSRRLDTIFCKQEDIIKMISDFGDRRGDKEPTQHSDGAGDDMQMKERPGSPSEISFRPSDEDPGKS